MTTINSADSLFSFMRKLDTCQRQDSLNQQLADIKPVLAMLNLNKAVALIKENNIQTDYVKLFFTDLKIEFQPADNFTNAAAVANFLGCYDAASYLTDLKLI